MNNNMTQQENKKYNMIQDSNSTASNIKPVLIFCFEFYM